MKVGDKARAKTDNPGLPKGTTGEIIYIDDFTGKTRIFIGHKYHDFTPEEFKEIFDLVKEEKNASCPAALKAWHKACGPYLGGSND